MRSPLANPFGQKDPRPRSLADIAEQMRNQTNSNRINNPYLDEDGKVKEDFLLTPNLIEPTTIDRNEFVNNLNQQQNYQRSQLENFYNSNLNNQLSNAALSGGLDAGARERIANNVDYNQANALRNFYANANANNAKSLNNLAQFNAGQQANANQFNAQTLTNTQRGNRDIAIEFLRQQQELEAAKANAAAARKAGRGGGLLGIF